MEMLGKIIRAIMIGILIMILLPVIFLFGGVLVLFIPQLVIGVLCIACIIYLFADKK